ncbi:hypothetical protein [Sandaracinus amylolyticus]|uniref:Uncharacterized protein n=1 Tax=Sandaracinus amylolyticus TaxID=927083 RepID=A0A0F6W132_9BACT|nr:hypothetical protein [Sandaracinus amylolyticus]AKF04565.1 hypothetical protein DB32_001714 [Sandaracinus amylolyticus]
MTTRRDDEDDDALLRDIGALLREEEQETSMDAFGPLSPDEERALADGVLDRIGRATEEPGANVVPLAPRRRVRTWPAIAGAVAVAAALVLVLLPRRGPELPAYELVPPRPDATHRGDEQPASEEGYALGRELEVVLRPARRVERVGAQVLVERSEALTPLDASVEPADGGTLVVRVPTGEGTALDRAGTARLVFVVAPEGETSEGAQRLVWSVRLVE